MHEHTSPTKSLRAVWITRYLCAVDSTFLGMLSSSSLVELDARGGPMSRGEVQHFKAHPCFEDAVWLASIDNEAKLPGKVVPRLTQYKNRWLHPIVPADT